MLPEVFRPAVPIDHLGLIKVSGGQCAQKIPVLSKFIHQMSKLITNIDQTLLMVNIKAENCGMRPGRRLDKRYEQMNYNSENRKLNFVYVTRL